MSPAFEMGRECDVLPRWRAQAPQQHENQP
jgi:hypothetical protein